MIISVINNNKTNFFLNLIWNKNKFCHLIQISVDTNVGFIHI